MITTYKRDLGHNYMILQEEEIKLLEDFRMKMLLYNEIDSILKCDIQKMNCTTQYRYDITSKQTMQRVFERHSIQYHDLQFILSGLLSMTQAAKEYMLNMNHFLLEETYIYMNIESGTTYFCYYPAYERPIKESFHKLSEYFLNRVDHTDKKAVIAVYELYRKTMEDNYNLEDLIRSLFEKEQYIQNEPEVTRKNETMESRSSKIEDGYIPHEKEEKLIAKEKATKEKATKEKATKDKVTKERSRTETIDKIKSYALVLILILFELGNLLFLACLYLIPAFKNRFKGEEIMKLSVLSFVVTAVLLYFIVILLKKQAQKDGGEEEFILEKEDYEIPNNGLIGAEQISDSFEDEIQQKMQDTLHSNEDRWVYDSISEREKEKKYGDTVILSYKTQDKAPKLICNSGLVKDFSIDKQSFLIGKLEQNVDGFIPVDSISRIHAEIKKEDGIFYLIDLNSTNGTFINGVQLETNDPIMLKDKDQVVFADVEFMFKY